MEDLILKLALNNAVKYNGKANSGAVIGAVFSQYKNAKKEEVIKKVNEIIKKVNFMSLEEQTKKLEKLAPEMLEKKKIVEERILHELPNVKGKVVMRFAPYPSGPIHVGNARQAILNDEYVKKYKGKLLLVIDDTIGSAKKNIVKEAYDLIPESLKWLEVKFDKKIIYKSDRLNIYYKYAEELIKKGHVYVCACSSESLRENRAAGRECKCRSQSIDITLSAWKNMFDADEGSASLRIKTDMQHKNPAFRDRVIFRISDREHPRVGNKFRVWPLLDFSWAIDDYLLKITHVLRGKDLMIETDMEKFIWDLFGWKGPEVIHTGLLQIEGVKLSKSKSKEEVMSGKFKGWDDPRTYSIQSLARRGIKPEAIRKFLMSFGTNENEITAPIDTLYSENKKLIDEKANRYFFVNLLKKIKIKNAPKMSVKAPLHPQIKRGSRILKTEDEFYLDDDIKKDKLYRFMHLFNFKNNEFLSKDFDKNLNAQLIHWLPTKDNLVKVEVLMDDGSLVHGLGEKDLKNVKLNEIIQFERKYFAKLDKKEKDKLTFWFTHQ
ncbi:MAG TPA: glutamate--tRNA ligase [Candidatus Nanoarchaeia archaeon]|nr:glutamate--tRNA ligase [Candidatus Nanoarchaeia archaeon]